MFSSVDETGLTKVSESLSAGSVHIKDGLDNIGLSLAVLGLFVMVGMIQFSNKHKQQEDKK